jgi:hypothetical protein
MIGDATVLYTLFHITGYDAAIGRDRFSGYRAGD